MASSRPVGVRSTISMPSRRPTTCSSPEGPANCAPPATKKSRQKHSSSRKGSSTWRGGRVFTSRAALSWVLNTAARSLTMSTRSFPGQPSPAQIRACAAMLWSASGVSSGGSVKTLLLLTSTCSAASWNTYSMRKLVPATGRSGPSPISGFWRASTTGWASIVAHARPGFATSAGLPMLKVDGRWRVKCRTTRFSAASWTSRKMSQLSVNAIECPLFRAAGCGGGYGRETSPVAVLAVDPQSVRARRARPALGDNRLQLRRRVGERRDGAAVLVGPHDRGGRDREGHVREREAVAEQVWAAVGEAVIDLLQAGADRREHLLRACRAEAQQQAEQRLEHRVAAIDGLHLHRRRALAERLDHDAP